MQSRADVGQLTLADLRQVAECQEGPRLRLKMRMRLTMCFPPSASPGRTCSYFSLAQGDDLWRPGGLEERHAAERQEGGRGVVPLQWKIAMCRHFEFSAIVIRIFKCNRGLTFAN